MCKFQVRFAALWIRGFSKLETWNRLETQLRAVGGTIAFVLTWLVSWLDKTCADWVWHPSYIGEFCMACGCWRRKREFFVSQKVYDLFHSIRVLLLLPTSTTHATHQEQDEQIWIQIEFIENCGKNISIKIHSWGNVFHQSIVLRN